MATLNQFGFVTSAPEILNRPTMLDYLVEAYQTYQNARDARAQRELKKMELELRKKQIEAQVKNIERMNKAAEREEKKQAENEQRLQAFRRLLFGDAGIYPTTVEQRPPKQFDESGTFIGPLPSPPPLPGMEPQQSGSSMYDSLIGAIKSGLSRLFPQQKPDRKTILLNALQTLPPDQYDEVARLMQHYEEPQKGIQFGPQAGGKQLIWDPATRSFMTIDVPVNPYVVTPWGVIPNPNIQSPQAAAPAAPNGSMLYSQPVPQQAAPAPVPAPTSTQDVVSPAPPNIVLPNAEQISPPPPTPTTIPVEDLPDMAALNAPPEPRGAMQSLYSDLGTAKVYSPAEISDDEVMAMMPKLPPGSIPNPKMMMDAKAKIAELKTKQSALDAENYRREMERREKEQERMRKEAEEAGKLSRENADVVAERVDKFNKDTLIESYDSLRSGADDMRALADFIRDAIKRGDSTAIAQRLAGYRMSKASDPRTGVRDRELSEQLGVLEGYVSHVKTQIDNYLNDTNNYAQAGNAAKALDQFAEAVDRILAGTEPRIRDLEQQTVEYLNARDKTGESAQLFKRMTGARKRQTRTAEPAKQLKGVPDANGIIWY